MPFKPASEYEVLRCEPFTVNIVVDAEQFNTSHQSRDHAAMRPGDRGHRLNIRIGDQSAADPGFTPVLCMWGPGAGDTGRVEGSQS